MVLTVSLITAAVMAYIAKKAKASPRRGSVSVFFTPPPGWTPDTMARVPSSDINLIPLYLLPWLLWGAGARGGALGAAAVAVCLRLLLRSIEKGEGAAPPDRKAGSLALPDDLPDAPLRVPPPLAPLALLRRTASPWVLPFTQEPYFGGVVAGLIVQSATTLAPWLAPQVQKALREGGLLGLVFSMAVCIAELCARELENTYGPRSKG